MPQSFYRIGRNLGFIEGGRHGKPRILPRKDATTAGLYAHGVEVPEDAKLTFVAGQVGMDFDGNVPDDFEGQARNGWNNCLAMLEHNNLRVERYCPREALHHRRRNLPAYNTVRADYLGETAPRRPC